MSIIKNLIACWFLIGACYAYSLRESWVPKLEGTTRFGQFLIIAAVALVCLFVAPIFEALFFIGDKIKFKEKK